MLMQPKRYRPELDKCYGWISISISALMLIFTVAMTFLDPRSLFFDIPITLFVAFFTVSPLFGYAEFRESSLFIKFGFFLKREIPYEKIRGVEKCRKFYSDSMLALKTSLTHLNVKYNRFDMLSVSLKNSEDFIEELNSKIK